jgi:hypothetical protein
MLCAPPLLFANFSVPMALGEQPAGSMWVVVFPAIPINAGN